MFYINFKSDKLLVFSMCIERLEIPAAVTLGEAEWGVDPPAEFQNHNISGEFSVLSWGGGGGGGGI